MSLVLLAACYGIFAKLFVFRIGCILRGACRIDKFVRRENGGEEFHAVDKFSLHSYYDISPFLVQIIYL